MRGNESNLYCIYFQFKIFNLIHSVHWLLFANRVQNSSSKPQGAFDITLRWGDETGKVINCLSNVRIMHRITVSVSSPSSPNRACTCSEWRVNVKEGQHWISWKSNYFIFWIVFLLAMPHRHLLQRFSRPTLSVCCDLARSRCCCSRCDAAAVEKMLCFFCVFRWRFIG